jgi:predicted DNA-binding transcriptional regulator YafY
MVRFQASGMKELAWHLFTWGDKVEILAPPSLKDAMLGELDLALARHRPTDRAGLAERALASHQEG